MLMARPSYIHPVLVRPPFQMEEKMRMLDLWTPTNWGQAAGLHMCRLRVATAAASGVRVAAIARTRTTVQRMCLVRGWLTGDDWRVWARDRGVSGDVTRA